MTWQPLPKTFSPARSAVARSYRSGDDICAIAHLSEGVSIWDYADRHNPRLFFAGRVSASRLSDEVQDGYDVPHYGPRLDDFLFQVREGILDGPLAGVTHISGVIDGIRIQTSSFTAGLADPDGTPRYIVIYTKIHPRSYSESQGMLLALMANADSFWFEPADLGFGIPDTLQTGTTPAHAMQ